MSKENYSRGLQRKLSKQAAMWKSKRLLWTSSFSIITTSHVYHKSNTSDELVTRAMTVTSEVRDHFKIPSITWAYVIIEELEKSITLKSVTIERLLFIYLLIYLFIYLFIYLIIYNWFLYSNLRLFYLDQLKIWQINEKCTKL